MSKSSPLLQFLEKGQAAETRLSFSVLPQNEQVVRRACNQTFLRETYEHLK